MAIIIHLRHMLLAVTLLTSYGCADDPDKKSDFQMGEHMLKEQQRALDKAKEVEDLLGKSFNQQQHAIEKQSQ